jgi:hypothetical protein
VLPFFVFEIKCQCQDSQPAASENVELPNNKTTLQSCYERAVAFIEGNRVELNTSRQTFTIHAVTEPRLVRLFPIVKCPCNPTRIHAHILAAQLSIRFHNSKTKKPNATPLLKRNRQKADKLSGRKQPRYADLDQKSKDDAGSEKDDGSPQKYTAQFVKVCQLHLITCYSPKFLTVLVVGFKLLSACRKKLTGIGDAKIEKTIERSYLKVKLYYRLSSDFNSLMDDFTDEIESLDVSEPPYITIKRLIDVFKKY